MPACDGVICTDVIDIEGLHLIACCLHFFVHLVGCYSDSAGLELIRKHVAQYIERRDGFPSNPDDIVLCAGASEGIRSSLKLLSTISGPRTGIMIPIPQYPLYSASIVEYNMEQVGYYLDEDNDWGLDVKELERSIQEARKRCEVRGIVVINPGNPTGTNHIHSSFK